MDNDKMPEPVMWLHEQTGEILGNPWNPDDPLEQCKDPPVPLYSAETVQALLAEANEQARLNGMGAEHEARLMAQVERLRKLVAEQGSILARKPCTGLNADGNPRCHELAEAQAERDALAKDAARYRWLQSGGMYRVGFDSAGGVSLDSLDASIDAAMAEGE